MSRQVPTPSRSTARNRSAAVAAALCGALATPALAQDTAPPSGSSQLTFAAESRQADSRVGPDHDQRTSRLIEQLRTGTAIERLRASRELADCRPDELDTLIRALAPQEGDADLRTWLQSILAQAFSELPRAGMGVSFRPDTTGIVISTVSVGFPVADVLTPGDIVIGVSGRPIAQIGVPPDEFEAAFRLEIISRLPGETLALTILRGGKVLDVMVPLGRYDDLVGPTRLIGADLVAQALQLRVARVLGPQADHASRPSLDDLPRLGTPPAAQAGLLDPGSTEHPQLVLDYGPIVSVSPVDAEPDQVLRFPIELSPRPSEVQRLAGSGVQILEITARQAENQRQSALRTVMQQVRPSAIAFGMRDGWASPMVAGVATEELRRLIDAQRRCLEVEAATDLARSPRGSAGN